MFPPPLPPPTVPVIPVASTSSTSQQHIDSNSESPLQRQHSGGNSHTIHYAELADISEEPSYENTIIIPGKCIISNIMIVKDKKSLLAAYFY